MRGARQEVCSIAKIRTNSISMVRNSLIPGLCHLSMKFGSPSQVVLIRFEEYPEMREKTVVNIHFNLNNLLCFDENANT